MKMADHDHKLYLICDSDAKVLFRLGMAGQGPEYNESAVPLFAGKDRLVFEDFCRGADDRDIAVFSAGTATTFVCAVCRRQRYFANLVTEVMFIDHPIPDITNAVEYAASVLGDGAFSDTLPDNTRRRIEKLILVADEMDGEYGDSSVFNSVAVLPHIISKVKEYMPESVIITPSAEQSPAVPCSASLPGFTAITALSIFAALKLSSDNSCSVSIVPVKDSVRLDVMFSPKKKVNVSDGTLFELCRDAPSCAAEIAVLSNISDGTGHTSSVTLAPNGQMHICTAFASAGDPDTLKYSDHTSEVAPIIDKHIAVMEKAMLI